MSEDKAEEGATPPDAPLIGFSDRDSDQDTFHQRLRSAYSFLATSFDFLPEQRAYIDRIADQLLERPDDLHLMHGDFNGDNTELIRAIEPPEFADSRDYFLFWRTHHPDMFDNRLSPNDLPWAYNEDSVVFGGRGDDFLDGGLGDDRLVGGLGDDLLVGGAGTDALSGGLGADVLVFNAGDYDVSMNAASGNDELGGRDSDDRLAGGFNPGRVDLPEGTAFGDRLADAPEGVAKSSNTEVHGNMAGPSREEIDAKLGQLEAQLEARLVAVDSKLDRLNDHVDHKLDRLGDQMTSKLDRLADQVSNMVSTTNLKIDALSEKTDNTERAAKDASKAAGETKWHILFTALGVIAVIVAFWQVWVQAIEMMAAISGMSFPNDMPVENVGSPQVESGVEPTAPLAIEGATPSEPTTESD